MLTYDPIPWLMAQDGMPAVRARRSLNLDREGDERVVRAIERRLARDQLGDGSFDQSLMKTAGVLNLLDDLKPTEPKGLIEMGASYLLSVLRSQPGCEQAREIKPGNLQTPWDLCGFFGPYEDRNQPEVLARGAREMNFYREYEPVLGPKSPVRGVRRSGRDRPGPGSCYAWGLIPLCYTVEALCRAGYAQDERIQPPINALLGAQRESGGWCRNLGGHPSCTIHAVRALGSHPELRQSEYAERALRLMQAHWKGLNLFALVRAIAAFDLPIARDIIHDVLPTLAPRQRKNGTFGSPHAIERVAAVLAATKAYEG